MAVQVVFDAAMGYTSGMNEVTDSKEKKGSKAGGDAPIPRKLGGRRESKVRRVLSFCRTTVPWQHCCGIYIYCSICFSMDVRNTWKYRGYA